MRESLRQLAFTHPLRPSPRIVQRGMIRAIRDGARIMSSYAPQACDTAEAVDRLVFDGLRAMRPTERLALAARASAALERLSMAGLRARCPGLSEEELRSRPGALRLGGELTLRAFGAAAGAWLP